MATSDKIQTLAQPAAPLSAGNPATPTGKPSSGLAGLFWVPLVLLFAFLLASFPARNSDLWAHLAAGRDLASGAFSATGNTWLYDLVCYALFQAFGGPALVLGKALLVAGVALVLVRLCRAGQGWWLPAFCTGLALLAMSTRLLLQPATVSYLFLALTLWALRFDEEVREATPSVLPPWPLLLLFLVWANTDTWFVLGLAVVALTSLGQGLDGPVPAGGRGMGLLRRASALAILAAVCLLNPAHVHAFTLPPELAWLGTAGASAPRLTSPFQPAYFTPGLGLSPAGLAYFPLLGLGLLSFILTPPWSEAQGRWQWFLPWLGLAVLSAIEVRAAPFFAIVGGPVLAGNLQAFFARRPEAGMLPGPVTYVLAGILGLAFLLCAWPGWLQAPPHEPRRCTVVVPASLEEGAAVVARWHREGKLGPDSHGLHLSPDSAEAFAWFCPQDKAVLDRPLASALRGDENAPDDWPQRMRAAGIDHVLVYETQSGRREVILGRLFADPEQWPLLHLEGELVIFGWRDPQRPASDKFRDWQLDLNRLAFHPTEDEKAPAAGPEQTSPGPRSWWEAFYKLAPPHSPDRDEALIHLVHAQTLGQQAAYRHPLAWQVTQLAGLWASLATRGAGDAAPIDIRLRLAWLQLQWPAPGQGPGSLPPLGQAALGFYLSYAYHQDDMPPALLYLAIRAARRALAVNPEDARAHLALGESYLRLLHDTRERAWGRRFPEIVQLRRAQASAALHRAAALEPDYAQAHRSLGELYQEMGYRDLALHHWQTYLALKSAAGPPPGADLKTYRAQEEQSRRNLDKLAKDVKELEDRYAVEAAGKPILDRAFLAAARGLAGKARDLLLESDVAAFGDEGMKLELELLVGTGRADEVAAWTAPEHQAPLGPAVYHWLRARAFAATGDYVQSAEECNQLGLGLNQQRNPATRELREGMALLIAQALLARNTDQAVFRARMNGLAHRLRRMADWTTLRGLIALEQGDVAEAKASFRDALAIWGDEATAASGGGLDFNGRVVAQQGLQWLE